MGRDQLSQGLIGIRELGPDDERVHTLLAAAIESDELTEEELGTACGALGSCLHAVDRQEEAETLLKRSVVLGENPSRLAMGHYELAETLQQLGELRSSEVHCRESLALERTQEWASEALTLLGKAVVSRADGDQQAVEEAYDCFVEAEALLESPNAGNLHTFFPPPKALFDVVRGKAICLGALPGDSSGFRSAEAFKKAEQLALAFPEHITGEELADIYGHWIGLYQRMHLDRDAQLVSDRARRRLG